MNKIAVQIVLVAGAVLSCGDILAEDVKSSPPTSDRAADEAAIRASAEVFVTAYNRHDAKAIAELFAPEAQLVDDMDNTVQGRQAIADLFSGVFREFPNCEIEVVVESIRLFGTSLAIETGSSRTTYDAASATEVSRYKAVHVRRDGEWQIALVHDLPDEPSHHDHLQDLAWLVGDWIDESREGVVRTSCRWTDDGNFLLQDIVVRQAGQSVMTMSQRIGWDPLTRQFRSWVFDSMGGFGTGVWTATDSGWVIKSTGVSSDGTATSATNSITPDGVDRYLFRSVDRILNGQLIPSVDVPVVRAPPTPQAVLPE